MTANLLGFSNYIAERCGRMQPFPKTRRYIAESKSTKASYAQSTTPGTQSDNCTTLGDHVAQHLHCGKQPNQSCTYSRYHARHTKPQPQDISQSHDVPLALRKACVGGVHALKVPRWPRKVALARHPTIT